MTFQKSKFRSLTTLYTQRAGLSLIEVLIGLTVTLIVLGAMAGAFRFASQEMAKGRASLELSNRLRTVENLLRNDLQRLTVELKPYHRLPATPDGYAEIIDGQFRDVPIAPATIDATNERLLLGDYDDILAGTIRAVGKPFRGRYLGGVQESHLAEVIWFTTFSDNDGDGVNDRIRLFRRQLVIKPSLGVLGAAANYNTFIQQNDISCRIANGDIVANSLVDLTVRGNRFAHTLGATPQTSPMNQLILRADDQYQAAAGAHVRASDQSDLLLSDLVAFDVRVFAPDALWGYEINSTTKEFIEAAEPSEAWQFVPNTSLNRLGSYVDLGKGSGLLGSSSGYAEQFFDTGTNFYETTALFGGAAVGSDGIDSDGVNGVDDDGEEIARPPYDTPIRGLEVIIRMYEPNSGQASQVSLRQSMVPQ